ncbi:MAG: hypothetical protein R2911_20725 [Caldilineaceae bacterium]
MSTYAAIGAIFYAPGDFAHCGAGVLLMQAYAAGGVTVLAAIGSATPAAAIPQIESDLLAAVLGYYAWNLVWIGAFVVAKHHAQLAQRCGPGYLAQSDCGECC